MIQKDRSCNQDLAFSCKGIKPPVAADGRILLRASDQQVSHVRVGAKASSKHSWGGSEIPLQGPHSSCVPWCVCPTLIPTLRFLGSGWSQTLHLC